MDGIMTPAHARSLMQFWAGGWDHHHHRNWLPWKKLTNRYRNKINILSQSVCIYTLLYMHIMYIQCVLHKHIHECTQAIKLCCLARNIFLPLFENFAYLEPNFHLIRQLKNIKDTTLEDNATRKWTECIKWMWLHYASMFFLHFFPVSCSKWEIRSLCQINSMKYHNKYKP